MMTGLLCCTPIFSAFSSLAPACPPLPRSAHCPLFLCPCHLGPLKPGLIHGLRSHPRFHSRLTPYPLSCQNACQPVYMENVNVNANPDDANANDMNVAAHAK